MMSGSGAPTVSQPKPATSDSGYIHMSSPNPPTTKSSSVPPTKSSSKPPATKSSSMPPYVNIAAYMELIQNIIRPKTPDYVNVPAGTGPIREEEPKLLKEPVKVTTTSDYKSMSGSSKPSYSIACCKCSCPPPPMPDYVNISSIQPGTGVEHNNQQRCASPVVVQNTKDTSSHRSSPTPDYINVGPWLTKQTENIYANVGSHAAANCPVEEVNTKNACKGTLNGHPPLSSNVEPDGLTQSSKDCITLPTSGESSTDIAYISRFHPNNAGDYMFITPGGGRLSDRSTTVSPSSDYLSSLPLSPRSVFSTSSGSTSPRPYASPTPDYMVLGFDSDRDQKDGDGPVFSQVHLPIRRVSSMVSPSEIMSRSRKLSICSTDSGQQSQSSYMEMKPSNNTTGRKRSGKFVRSRSLKESSYNPRPQLMHSHSVDEEFEVSTYIVADIGSSPPNTHSDYMCMTPPGDDDDIDKSICDDDGEKPLKPFDNLIEPRHYVGSKVTIPTKPTPSAIPEVKNSPDTKPEQPKSLLSRIIRRNSSKDRKSILKTPDDSLSSPIESVAEVAEDKPVVQNVEGFPFVGDPFGLLGPQIPKDGGDTLRQKRFSKQWPEECNLTDEEKQCYSLTPESPPALPVRKYKLQQMTESPAYMLMNPGGMIKNDHTASSSTLQPDDDDDSTSQIYFPSDEEDLEDLPPDLPEKTRVYSAIGRMEGNDEFAGTRTRTLSSSSENMLTDDLKFRSQTASPRMTLPRSKRETKLTIFVPRNAEMDDDVWLTKSASNTTGEFFSLFITVSN